MSGWVGRWMKIGGQRDEWELDGWKMDEWGEDQGREGRMIG